VSQKAKQPALLHLGAEAELIRGCQSRLEHLELNVEQSESRVFDERLKNLQSFREIL
jgi:hypothetical protein